MGFPRQAEDSQIRGLFFPAGADHARLVTVPFHEGVLYLHHWLCDAQRVSYLISRPEVRIVGVRRYTFKSFPTMVNPLFDHAYSIYYWTQEACMPINGAIACCSDGAPHLLLRGDAMVLKHRQSNVYQMEDVTVEDFNLIRAAVGRWVVMHATRRPIIC